MTRIGTYVVSAAALLSATLAAQSWEEPKSGKLDERVRFVAYDPYQVVRIVGALRTITQIELGADETVVNATVGDHVWEVGTRGNNVFLKPRDLHPKTNLQILTERPDGTTRSYQIELGLMPAHLAETKPPFLLVKYQYPSDDQAKRRHLEAVADLQRQAASAEKALKKDEANGPRNFAYSVQGEAAFEPAEVFDNGTFTTLRFSGNIEMPAIYVSAEDGSEELIPKTVKGEFVMVHTVARKLVLRRGDQVMCVFNEAYAAAGLNTGTATASPRVARTVVAPGSSPKPTDISRKASQDIVTANVPAPTGK